MTPKTPNEKLNFVLDYIKQQRSYNDLFREIDDHANFKGQFSSGEIDLIMDKLRDDGYIDFIAGSQISKDFRASDGLDIRRNFNGSVFNESGGYVQQAIDAASANRRIENIETSQLSLSKGLNVVTAWIAGGTIALVLVELLKLALERHWFGCH